MIFNATSKQWIPFRLWHAQKDVLETFKVEEHVIVLKARQLGLTWLSLCHLLHEMLFFPAATVLIFSKRDDEAVLLLKRLKDVHAHLPEWMQRKTKVDNDHHFELDNGSSAHAFPTTGGRSYTASHVLMDEADFMLDFGKVLDAVQPTIDAGGQIIVISTVDKEKPGSIFKNMYTAAVDKLTEYVSIFLPWHSRPSRTEDWYLKRVAESLAKTGTMDSVYQEYPATDEEALAELSANKRLLASWLAAAFEPLPAVAGGPAIPGLTVYKKPVKGRKYVIGADPAEGNPSSDDSAATLMDVDTGEEIALLRGKFEPVVFAAYIDSLSKWYNNAPAMVERNNHGHAILAALFLSKVTRRLMGRDGKPGWLNNTLGKTVMYDTMAETVRDNALDPEPSKLIHTRETLRQLSSIETATLNAPEGQMDDLADSFALAEVGRAAASVVVTNTQPTVSQVAL